MDDDFDEIEEINKEKTKVKLNDSGIEIKVEINNLSPIIKTLSSIFPHPSFFLSNLVDMFYLILFFLYLFIYLFVIDLNIIYFLLIIDLFIFIY